MSEAIRAQEYQYSTPTWSCGYLWPVVKKIVESRKFPERRVFDLGCGNGSTCKLLYDLGFAATGVDPSESGIEVAQTNYPQCTFAVGNAYDDLAAIYGRFPLVVSLEVVEHCYDPARFAQTLLSLVQEGGVALVSTPYHGYLKNLALAASGKLDNHFGPLWCGGHIKFFSLVTFRGLLEHAGFRDIKIFRAGRIPPFAKSMIALASR